MRTLIVLLLFAVNLGAQETPHPQFVLDAKKPYVYLEYDHVGQRKPLGEDESNHGLWLKFVNNCRLPVTIWTLSGESTNPGITVEDEVVPVSGVWGVGEPPETISPPISTTLVPPGQNAKRQSRQLPNQKSTGANGGTAPASPATGREPGPPAAAYELVKRPIGYGFDIGSLETVNPGESALFSVPLEHVSPRWYLQVRFTLEVSPYPRGYEVPDSYVGFHWNNLPDKVKSQSK